MYRTYTIYSPAIQFFFMCWFIGCAGYYWSDPNSQFMSGLNLGFGIWALVNLIRFAKYRKND